MRILSYIICFVFLFLGKAYAVPIHTNSDTFTTSEDVGPDFDAALWSWSGYDDQAFRVDFTEGPISNASFRLSYPVRGSVYLDINAGVTVTPVAVIIQTNDIWTNCYSAIVYTNYYPAYTAATYYVTNQLTYYTNFSSALTASVVATYGYSNPALTQIVATCVAYTGTAATMTVPSYGTYTSYWQQLTNLLTYSTNNVIANKYGSNLVENGDFSSISNAWVFGGSINVMPSRYNATLTGFSSSGELAQAIANIVSGQVYELSFGYNSYHPGNFSTAVVTFAGTTNTVITPYMGVNIVTARSAEAFYAYGINAPTGSFAAIYREAYFDNISIRHLHPGQSNVAIAVVTNIYPSSNLVLTAYAESNRVNTKFYYSSTDVFRVTAGILSRTNLPPDGIYYGEWLAYDTATTNLSRTLAKLQVDIQHSLYANTNQSSWTNPAAGTTIGPPTHNLTSLSGWPFASSVANVGSESNWLSGPASGLLTHYYDTNVIATYANETSTFASVLSRGNSAGTNNINMNGRSITNIATNSVGFADGTAFGSADVRRWNTHISTNDADTRYVNTSGDIVTGTLTVQQTNTLNVGNFQVAALPSSGISPDDYAIRFYKDAQGTNTWLFITNNGSLIRSGFQTGVWHQIWDAAIDGSGSGLDADLLDGAEASTYLNETSTLNNVVLRGARAETNIVLGIHDTTGGKSYEIRFAGRNDGLGYSYTNRMYMVDQSGSQEISDLYIGNATNPTVTAGGKIWHSRNDGAGSTLDADLLDGLSSASFVLDAGDIMTGPLTGTTVFAQQFRQLGNTYSRQDNTSFGTNNTASGIASIAVGFNGTATGDYSGVLSGFNNTNLAGSSVIVGGRNNKINGAGSLNSSVIAGGLGNQIIGGSVGTILGGENNVVSADNATTIGGSGNTATGNYSLAAGYAATAAHAGSFVWSGGLGNSIASTTTNQWMILSSGGVIFTGLTSSGTFDMYLGGVKVFSSPTNAMSAGQVLTSDSATKTKWAAAASGSGNITNMVYGGDALTKWGRIGNTGVYNFTNAFGARGYLAFDDENSETSGVATAYLPPNRTNYNLHMWYWSDTSTWTSKVSFAYRYNGQIAYTAITNAGWGGAGLATQWQYNVYSFSDANLAGKVADFYFVLLGTNVFGARTNDTYIANAVLEAY